MACSAARDRVLIVNGVNLTPWVKSLELKESVNTYECTTTSDKSKRYGGGTIERELSVTFSQDYAAGAVHRTIAPLVGTNVSVTAQPTSGASTRYVGEVVITENVPIPGGSGDDPAEFEVTWPGSGDWTRTN